MTMSEFTDEELATYEKVKKAKRREQEVQICDANSNHAPSEIMTVDGVPVSAYCTCGTYRWTATKVEAS